MTRKNAPPQRLYLMEVATAAWSKAGMPIVCYLIQTSDGKNILIDSGLPENFVPPPGLPDPEYGKNVVEQLALLGLHPGNIDLLICTHFDTDHTGYHAHFPEAELIAQRERPLLRHASPMGSSGAALSLDRWRYRAPPRIGTDRDGWAYHRPPVGAGAAPSHRSGAPSH
jgi:glyoxylase-like metal-dependent hydrolase (beta-lactamase superfamily II)